MLCYDSSIRVAFTIHTCKLDPLLLRTVMSQSIPTGYILPGQPPGISSKNLPGGRHLTFKSCPGAGNPTQAGILYKMKVKLQKIAWIKFLQVKTKTKQVEFLTIFEVYLFSQWNFASSIGQFFGSAVTYTSQKSEEFPLAFLFEVFIGLWLSTPTFCIKDYDYVKHFVRVVVLLGCLKNLLKMGNTTLLISSSNYAKSQLNVCQEAICVPRF